MQAARLVCRPSLFPCRWSRPGHLQQATPRSPSLSTPTNASPLALPLRDRRYVAKAPSFVPFGPARIRAPSTRYEVPRRIVFPNAGPQFRRRDRRRPDGSCNLVPQPWRQTPIHELERELKWRAHEKPSLPMIKEILTILIKHRHRRPNATYYEALILGNCDPEHGSLASVDDVLDEIDAEGVPISASVYHAILKVRIDHVLSLQIFTHLGSDHLS